MQNKTTDKTKKRTFLYSFVRIFIVPLISLVYPSYCKERDKLNIDAPYILIANHQSLMDVFLIAGKVKRHEIRFLGKHTLRKNPILRFFVDKLHMIPVERHMSDMQAMRRCVNEIKDGNVLAIFPEGTRVKNSKLENMLSGAALIALKSKAKVVPLLVKSPPKPFRITRLVAGDTIEYEDILEKGVNKESCDELLDRMRQAILELDNKL